VEGLARKAQESEDAVRLESVRWDTAFKPLDALLWTHESKGVSFFGWASQPLLMLVNGGVYPPVL